MSVLNPQQTFASFVVGAGNRLAVTAARAVAESPVTVYNPLFIYARPGLGKTHLLTAIGNAVLAAQPEYRVEYQTLDQFVEAFQGAIMRGDAEAYRRRYLELNLLLIDDVQFLATRREAQAELLRLIDTLQNAGRQIVLASDRPPADIEALDERLVTRFAGGLVIDISAPDYETRVAILRRRAEDRGARFNPGVLEAVAELPLDNVRELLGALNRLIAFQSVGEGPLDPARAKQLAAGPTLGTGESAAGRGSARDEFGAFLSEISQTVAKQVDAWRTHVAEAVLRWEGEGFATVRLNALLDGEMADDPEAAIRQYEVDVARLRAFEAEAAALVPAYAGHEAFRDPDNLAAAEALLQLAREEAEPPPAPAKIWRLDDFVEAPGNRLGVRAAYAVLDQPAQRYNPFVIVGESGTGKTHLLHAIGNALSEQVGAVFCQSASEFTADLIDALAEDQVQRWRSRCRRANALLIDDVHLFAGKDATQDELFLLLNTYLERGQQTVFTSSLPPSSLQGIEPRILSRLEAGLVVELPTPDRAFRHEVVERVLSERLGRVDPELAAYLAAQPADSVRSVQGLVQRVLGAAEAQGRPVSAALARDLLEGPTTPVRGPSRSSGIVAPTPAGVRTREKMVLEWPDIGDRLIEEWQ